VFFFSNRVILEILTVLELYYGFIYCSSTNSVKLFWVSNAGLMESATKQTDCLTRWEFIRLQFCAARTGLKYYTGSIKCCVLIVTVAVYLHDAVVKGSA
jgi:hypothetical protein